MTDTESAAQPFPPITAAAEREAARMAELKRYDILDTPPEAQFDRIVSLARMLFDTPIATITLVDHDRQWFKAKSGIDDTEGPRDQSFCSQAMEGEGVFFVSDAQADPRFSENTYVTGEPHIRFYAGAPLRSANGQNLGAVCVISPDARAEFSADDQRKLKVLASIVGNEMELRQRAQQAHKLMFDKDLALREAHYRIKNSLDYATLLAELNGPDMTTEQLAALAMTAWKQYSEAGAVLNGSVKALRERMPAQDYRDMLAAMPGFAM
jgi:GAF domain-containing protein